MANVMQIIKEIITIVRNMKTHFVSSNGTRKFLLFIAQTEKNLERYIKLNNKKTILA
jgi:cell wall assembly regulator SMI1